MDMNREIKFRAWDAQRGEFVTGSLLGVYAFKIGDDGTLKAWGTYETGIYEMPLMQFTGLKDRNGREIYEGDVVNVHFYHKPDKMPVIGKVYWSAGLACFHIRGNDAGTYSVSFKTGGNWGDTPAVEIIGNIYENPDLLA